MPSIAKQTGGASNPDHARLLSHIASRPRNFMIIAQARSGSTFLTELLNRQDDITCHGEVFSRVWIDRLVPPPGRQPLSTACIREMLPSRNSDPQGFMSNHVMRFPSQATGFKIIYDDFIDPRFQDALIRYAKANEVRIVHLRRRNHLAAFVSRARMSRFGIRHSDRPLGKNGDVQTGRIKVCSRELKRYTARQSALAAHIDATFPHALQLTYESLRDDFPRLLNHLAVDPDRPFYAPLRKLAPPDLSEVIENYAELRVFDRPPQPVW